MQSNFNSVQERQPRCNIVRTGPLRRLSGDIRLTVPAIHPDKMESALRLCKEREFKGSVRLKHRMYPILFQNTIQYPGIHFFYKQIKEFKRSVLKIQAVCPLNRVRSSIPSWFVIRGVIFRFLEGSLETIRGKEKLWGIKKKKRTIYGGKKKTGGESRLKRGEVEEGLMGKTGGVSGGSPRFS